MGDLTPKRPPNSASNGFSPITLRESPAAASPQKNLTGLPRVARDLVADLYNSIQRWNDSHIKGANIAKQITSLKLADPLSFTPALEELTIELFYIVGKLRSHKEALLSYVDQMKALAKLQKDPKPLFISLNLNALANLVHEIVNAYDAEFKMKEFVLEHIALVKDKSEAMFFAVLWTYQHKITESISIKLETLLIETGHRKFN